MSSSILVFYILGSVLVLLANNVIRDYSLSIPENNFRIGFSILLSSRLVDIIHVFSGQEKYPLIDISIYFITAIVLY